MILVKFSGGIGNQLFQFALYQKLKHDYPGVTVKADLTDYVLHDVHNGFELEHVFHVITKGHLQAAGIGDHWKCRRQLPVLAGGDVGKRIEVLIAWINARTRRLAERNSDIECIEEEPYHLHLNADEKLKRRIECAERIRKLNPMHNYYIDGYWQDELYYPDQLEKLAAVLTFTNVNRYVTEVELGKKLQTTESASIHLRCGDYLASDYDVLTKKYYQNAVEKLKSMTSVEQFYIFSDDIEKAKTYFSWLPQAVFIEGHQAGEAWLDLYLMSRCKHHILANSSFSTWGTYLSNMEGITIYPSKYTKTEENLFRKKWIRMDCE